MSLNQRYFGTTLSRTSLCARRAGGEHEQHAHRSATALRHDVTCACRVVITVRSRESKFAYSAAALRHVCEMHGDNPVGTIQNQRSTIMDLGIALRHQKHRQRLQAFASVAEARSTVSAFEHHGYLASAREVLARVSCPSFQPLVSNTVFCQQARLTSIGFGTGGTRQASRAQASHMQ